MPQSLAQVWLHMVFSTKNHRPYLKDSDFRDQMFRMLAHHTKESGCGVFSLSYSSVGVVKRYISNQNIHHSKRSFKDEFRLLCKKHGIAIDERYVWE